MDKKDDKEKEKEEEKKHEENKTIELNAGEIIEIGEDKYTVDDKGNLVDKDGKIFKESKDVQDYLKTLEQEDEEKDKEKNKNAINIKNIQEALEYEIVDENDKPIEYTDDIDGIKSYIKDVIDQSTAEIQEGTINTLFEKYPFIEQMLNYYIANGNSLDGWNVEVDRSNITIDDNNESQQEEIIKTAWREQKRTGDVDGYIAYLKSSGKLLDTARIELEGLKTADKNRKEYLEKQAKEAREQEQKETAEFWKGVDDIIKSRKIAGYKIPEQIKVQKNGKTMMLAPNDFYRYISQTDKNGETAYVRDCKAVSAEEQLNDSLLRAYLMFTGGNYSSLVDMAVKEKEVKTLKFKAANDKQHTRRYKSSNSSKQDKNIDLGF